MIKFKGPKVVWFEVCDLDDPSGPLFTVEGEDCQHELQMPIRPGLLVGRGVVIGNVDVAV